MAGIFEFVLVLLQYRRSKSMSVPGSSSFAKSVGNQTNWAERKPKEIGRELSRAVHLQ